jgi:hypothetical protein
MGSFGLPMSAAESGKMERVNWAIENGAEKTISAFQVASRKGNLEVLDFFFPDRTPETLKWLHSRECPWDIDFPEICTKKSCGMI